MELSTFLCPKFYEIPFEIKVELIQFPQFPVLLRGILSLLAKPAGTGL